MAVSRQALPASLACKLRLQTLVAASLGGFLE
jgi:hypothetical protein